METVAAMEIRTERGFPQRLGKVFDFSTVPTRIDFPSRITILAQYIRPTDRFSKIEIGITSALFGRPFRTGGRAPCLLEESLRALR